MKSFLFILILLLAIFTGCKKEKVKTIDELPLNIIRTEASPTLYEKIIDLFPDGADATVNAPALFTDTVQKNIITTDETEVYVTFIAEGAKYTNTLGWYSYNKSNPPKSINDIKINILFPNISADGEGGLLKQGYMLKVGDSKFPRGTVIGFFLIVNGWNNGTIQYSNTTFYTDYTLNTDLMQHHILFKEKSNADIILGFEDMSKDQSIDKDYNDILIKISDNMDNYESIYFEGLKNDDTKKITVL
jgi:hypothetical protein